MGRRRGRGTAVRQGTGFGRGHGGRFVGRVGPLIGAGDRSRGWEPLMDGGLETGLEHTLDVGRFVDELAG